MAHSIDDILTLIYAIGDTGSNGTKIAIGDPSGARIKIAGTSYERGAMLESGSPMRGIIQGIFDHFSTDHHNVTGIDLSSAGSDYSTAIGGDGTSSFVVSHIIFNMTAATGAPLGNARVKVGITAGGDEILPLTTLTGLVNADQLFVVTMDGLINKIADDETIYVRVQVADAGAGAGTLVTATLQHYYL